MSVPSGICTRVASYWSASGDAVGADTVQPQTSRTGGLRKRTTRRSHFYATEQEVLRVAVKSRSGLLAS